MKNKDLKKPFFANFLENQLSNNEENKIQGGATTKPVQDTVQTSKYPFDYDDFPTNKYPWDSEESLT